MDLIQEIEKAQRGYKKASPRSARRTEKYREHVKLKLKLLQWKPRKSRRAHKGNFDLEASA